MQRPLNTNIAILAFVCRLDDPRRCCGVVWQLWNCTSRALEMRGMVTVPAAANESRLAASLKVIFACAVRVPSAGARWLGGLVQRVQWGARALGRCSLTATLVSMRPGTATPRNPPSPQALTLPFACCCVSAGLDSAEAGPRDCDTLRPRAMRHRCASCGTNRARPPRSASSACFSHAAALVERLLWSLGPDGPTGGCTRAQDQEPGLIGCCPHAWLNAMVGGAKALALASQLKLCGRLLHPHALDGRGDRDRVAVVRARVPRPPSCARRDPCRSPHRSHTRAPPTVNLAPCAPPSLHLPLHVRRCRGTLKTSNAAAADGVAAPTAAVVPPSVPPSTSPSLPPWLLPPPLADVVAAVRAGGKCLASGVVHSGARLCLSL